MLQPAAAQADVCSDVTVEASAGADDVSKVKTSEELPKEDSNRLAKPCSSKSDVPGPGPIRL